MLTIKLASIYALLAIVSTATDDADVLVSHSLCGLIDRVNGTLFRKFEIDTSTRNYYLDAPDYALFVKTHGGGDDEEAASNLDYCGFAVAGDALQIDVLCDETMACVCTTYFDGKTCQQCSMDIENQNLDSTFWWNPVSSVHADCSGISEEWPDCLVLPDGDDEDSYPDVQQCFDLAKLPIPNGAASKRFESETASNLDVTASSILRR